MAFDSKLVIIGGGSMGQAISRGLVAAGFIGSTSLTVIDRNPEKLAVLKESIGCKTADSQEIASVLEGLSPETGDSVMVAVKPQGIPELLSAYREDFSGLRIISIAAGLKIATFEALLPRSARVIRVMPNLTCAVSEGASVVAGGAQASSEDVRDVVDMFGAIGYAVAVKESLIDVAGAISGCGPAYFALMIDRLTQAGITYGLPAEASRQLASATMGGTATLIAHGENPRVLMEKVSSPGGTTVSAVNAMENNLSQAIMNGVCAALERSKELAEQADKK